jgi:peptidoglycan lytic transglycosylase G
VSDWAQRSPEEREAARLERERRRAQRRGDDAPVAESPPPALTLTGPDGEAPFADEAPGEQPAEEPAGIRRVSGVQRGRFDRKRSAPRRPGGVGRTPHSLRGRIASIVAIVLAGALIWFLVELFQPFAGSGHGSVVIDVPAHSSSSQVGDLLASKGVISSSFFFELRATLAGQRGDLRPGRYHLKLGMSYGDVLKVLTTPPRPVPTTTLTLIEGKSRHQIDALLRSQGIRGSYIAATRHSPLLKPARYGAPRDTPSLEGFLFPSTYQLRKPVNIHALVAAQLKTFKRRFAGVNLSYARSRHLTAYDVLTIASIIEMEAATAHDRPLVASVIYNRLKDHMPLGMDSTTRYEFNDYDKPLTASQLAAHSPYNTRTHAGLPPTPIGNPGIAAIEAAAHPARTNYLYFVVKVCGNGSSVFSSNYQQFLRDSAKYQSARARRGGNSPSHC